MTNWTNITTFNQVLVSANAEAPFWTMIMFMLWVVLVITFLPFGVSVALVGGSFLGFLIAFLLLYMGLVPLKWVLVFLGIAIFIIIIDVLFSKKEQ